MGVENTDLNFKAKGSWTGESGCRRAKFTNEQNRCFEKRKRFFCSYPFGGSCSFLAVRFHTAMVTFRDACSSRTRRRTCSDCPVPRSPPSLAATDPCFVLFLFFCVSFLCLKITNQSKKSHSVFRKQLCDRAERLQEPAGLDPVCAAPRPLPGKRSQHLHYLYPRELAQADELLYANSSPARFRDWSPLVKPFCISSR